MEAFRLVFPEPYKIEIEKFEVGEPGRGELLIENEVSLISTGTELAYLGKAYSESWSWPRYPVRPGYSSVGRVVEVGDGVEGFEVGDRVATMARHATHAIVRAGDVVKVPDGVSSELASFHTIAAGVMNSVRLADVSLGETVVIVGLGLLGQMATIFSRKSGAFPVIAIDLSELRLRLAELSGANETILGGDWCKVREEVRCLTEGRMADKVFEVTGDPRVIPEAIKLARRQGYLIILSSPRGLTTLDFHDEVNSPSRIIVGTHFSSQPIVETPYNPWTRIRNTRLFFNLLLAGLIRVDHLITHRFRWDEAEKAYKMLLEDRTRALGVILKFKG